MIDTVEVCLRNSLVQLGLHYALMDLLDHLDVGITISLSIQQTLSSFRCQFIGDSLLAARQHSLLRFGLSLGDMPCKLSLQ